MVYNIHHFILKKSLMFHLLGYYICRPVLVEWRNSWETIVFNTAFVMMFLTFTFSMIGFIFASVNSDLSTLWSSPLSNLQWKVVIVQKLKWKYCNHPFYKVLENHLWSLWMTSQKNQRESVIFSKKTAKSL